MPVDDVVEVGRSIVVQGGSEGRLIADANGGEFLAVVRNVSLDSASRASFSLVGTGLGVPTPPGAFGTRLPLEPAALGRAGVAEPVRATEREAPLREGEQRELGPRFEAARAWRASRVPSLPRNAAVGDVVSINVNLRMFCSDPVRRGTRVAAVGARALILEDTLNPKPGFSAADYQRYAAQFDTLVYPLMVGAFGEPTDIDGNGRVAIVFTRAVNELAESGAGTFANGITFGRDLFPQSGTSRASACAASNEGELFYVLVPDPSGTINGNRRPYDAVAAGTTAALAHELVHVINVSRKLYVNTSATSFEEPWLDEGLAHVGEELLFYREAGLAPRQNLTFQALRSSPRRVAAYQAHMQQNAQRYANYLASSGSSSPYAAGHATATRGAAWSLLRYLADRASPSDGDVWSRLIDGRVPGVANLQSVFGSGLGSLLRDWSVSHALDDAPLMPAEYQQRSWNFRSVFGGIDGLAALYPLKPVGMTAGTSYTGSLVGGGALFYRLTVPPEGTATLALGAQSGTAGDLQLVLVRTR